MSQRYPGWRAHDFSNHARACRRFFLSSQSCARPPAKEEEEQCTDSAARAYRTERNMLVWSEHSSTKPFLCFRGWMTSSSSGNERVLSTGERNAPTEALDDSSPERTTKTLKLGLTPLRPRITLVRQWQRIDTWQCSMFHTMTD